MGEMGSVYQEFYTGGCARTEEEEASGSEEGASSLRGSGVCKWFNVRMGFGFLSMTSREGAALEPPVDVFVHQVSPSRALLGASRAALRCARASGGI
ncbi:hypothetical protein MHYP_G00303210 [Metynnis hypsauchen]